MNPPGFWVATIAPHVIGLVLAGRVMRWWNTQRERRDPAGKATNRELSALSAKALLGSADVLRPGEHVVRPEQLGFRVGIDARSKLEVWISAEDTMLVLAAPRSGKTMGFAILGWTTTGPSSRPEHAHIVNVTNQWRANIGTVWVCDPQRLVERSEGFRWSPACGCARQSVAVQRARSLCEATKWGDVEGGDFWSGQTQAVVRCYLAAAALEDLPITDVLGWVMDPDNRDPVDPGRTRHRIVGGRARPTDRRRPPPTWVGVAGVRRAFDSLADDTA